MSEPLKDKFGRTYQQLIAAGKNVLPKLNKWRVFVTRSPGRPKTKKTMDTPAPESKTPASAENSVDQSTPETALQDLAREEAGGGKLPGFDDVEAALKTAPTADTGDRADKLTEEIRAVSENPTAETVIGIIQTALILIGDEEGILSETEKTLIRPPLIRVLAKYNVGKDVMPCEIDLALALVGLVVARLKKPKTATAIAKAKAWLQEKFFARRGRQLAAVVQREAPSQ